MPLRTHGTKSPNQGSGNANGVGKSPMTPLIATSYGNVYCASCGDTTRLIARSPTVNAKQDKSVELVMTTPTTTTPFVVQTLRPSDEARDVNRGVMSQ